MSINWESEESRLRDKKRAMAYMLIRAREQARKEISKIVDNWNKVPERNRRFGYLIYDDVRDIKKLKKAIGEWRVE